MKVCSVLRHISCIACILLLWKPNYVDSINIKLFDQFDNSHFFDRPTNRVESSTKRQRRLNRIESKIQKSKMIWFPGSENTKILFQNQYQKHPLFTFIDEKISENPTSSTPKKITKIAKIQENQEKQEKRFSTFDND